MSEPFMSICIPTYNRAGHIGGAIASLLNQTYQDYEIIVSDNRSDDDTEQVVSVFGDRRIRFVRNEWNLGAARNHNRLLWEAKGKYIKFLHSDDRFVSDDALQLFYEAAMRYPQCGLITCGFSFDSGGSFSVPADMLRAKGFGTARECMNIHCFGLPSEWLIKKETIPYVGMFIDSPICDVDFMMKMVYSFDTFAIGKRLVEHRVLPWSETDIASQINGWEFMRFKALEGLPFYPQLSAEQKAVLSNYLHMNLLGKIKEAVEHEAYHIALQGAMDLLKQDPNMPYYAGEDRRRALEGLIDLLVSRRAPEEIAEYMSGQTASKPYADMFRFNLAFRYSLYPLIDKLRLTGRRIEMIGNGTLGKLFLQAFPEYKNDIRLIVETDPQVIDPTSEEGIPVIMVKDISLDFGNTFVILACEKNMTHHRYELIRSGLVEGVHFLPLPEII